MTPGLDRAAAWKALAAEPFDLLVVGGGITGAAIARDAALRGYRTALVEKDDFASGTSSRSSKFVHGGLRYLQQGHVHLVYESVNERRLLMQVARNVVRPSPFIFAGYHDGHTPLWMVQLGVNIYEALCFYRVHKLHRTLNAENLAAIEPGLRTEALHGGVLYYDCFADDARLTLENALDARALGAVVLNHARATALSPSDGKHRIARVTDTETKEEVEVRARVVMNATGPWCDEVRAMAGEAPILARSKGVHIVVDARKCPAQHTITVNHPKDGRAMFIIPWGMGHTVIGTTDTFYDGSSDDLFATRDDVGYLLESANYYFPAARLQPHDVFATWAGLRPLIKPPGGASNASNVSREHAILESPGLISVAGGKLTTYRRLAKSAVDHVQRQLGRQVHCTTHARPLPGSVGLESDAGLRAIEATLEKKGVSETVAHQLARSYGTRVADMHRALETDSRARTLLTADLPYVWGQVDEAVNVEMARTLDDVLSRRIPLILRDKDQGLSVASAVAERMERRLGWAPQRTQEELAAYRRTVALSRKFRE